MAFKTILVVFSFIVLALLVAVALHLGCLALRRAGWMSYSLATEIVIIGAPIAGGVVFLWKALGHAYGPSELLPVLPSSLKGGAVFLYLAGCLSCLEVQSLLSRGYSLRILVDLLERGGDASVDTLKSEYGSGLGIRGLIVKRVHTLVSLRFLHFQDNQVGPLTPLGKVVAMTTSRLREFLRLEMVG